MMHAKQNHTYIIAVSGGIDSVTLLDMLVHDKIPGVAPFTESRFIVAHVSHGIRPNSADDQEFVRQLAEKYGVEFETTSLNLGKDASEDTARKARYEFLETLAEKYHTREIVIAHHADDVIETAILNIMRGTGRSGLTSLRSRDLRKRPLLEMTKEDIRQYALDNHLEWVVDTTNEDIGYTRNHVRKNILRDASKEWKKEFATHLQKLRKTNDLIDSNIATLLQYNFSKKAVVRRSWFVKFEHQLACEVMRSILTKMQVTNISKDLVERSVIALKVARPGSTIDIDKEIEAVITKRSMRFVSRDTKKTLSV